MIPAAPFRQTRVAATAGAEAAAESAPGALHWLTVAALLIFACGDGVATAIQAERGLTSPYLLLVPFLAIAILLLALSSGISPRLLIWGMALTAFSTFTLLIQINVFRSINLDGYIQFWVIFLALFAVQDLVSYAPDRMVQALRRSLRALHYAVAAYLVATALVWYFFGYNLGIQALITNAPTSVSEFYGFRPAGLNREPAWAGFLLASTFIAMFFSFPNERLRALIAMIIGIAALRSGTAFAFTGVAILVIFVQRQRDIPLGRSLLVGAVASLVLISLFGQRVTTLIEGADPSGLMRFKSAGVASRVIEDSFPGGVGYGNFRLFAEYGREFSSYIDLLAAPEYKSDIAILNLIAEFGIGGMVIVIALFALYGRGHHPLFWAHLAALLFLAGGLLIPSNVIVAATIGLRERDLRLAAGRAGAVRQPPRLRRPMPVRRPPVAV